MMWIRMPVSPYLSAENVLPTLDVICRRCDIAIRFIHPMRFKPAWRTTVITRTKSCMESHIT